VAVYGEAWALVAAHVRAAFWDKAPDWIGTDPADLERPHVEVNVADDMASQLYLTPGQARSFAAALVRAADAADTEAFYRTPDTAWRNLAGGVRRCAPDVGLMPWPQSAWMGCRCPNRRAPATPPRRYRDGIVRTHRPHHRGR
jgi:hypothetical protein